MCEPTRMSVHNLRHLLLKLTNIAYVLIIVLMLFIKNNINIKKFTTSYARVTQHDKNET